MLAFVSVAKIEERFGRFEALVTLQDSGVPESFFIPFSDEPTAQQAIDAGMALAEKKNAQAADAELDALVGL